MKIGYYERIRAARNWQLKFCSGCGKRRFPYRGFCKECMAKLTPGILKGLENEKSFMWAYYEAMKILIPALYK
jgi:predicted amidophosphoribosyltransferase